ncbi:HAD family hydrolase [Brumimicrobium aurantiacum]|uniref:HAD family phosphatase n=1 Tax=Brumimicrobium aurantiacum TaxID=1737063 RepID=A0A3E1EVG5_9FLAO|nr:HAD family phosphatase [Brumimicrobium aurantiacum]RFC53554.1 HAD family phosphatase [Brumimicrobium aurantiacum]
MKIKNIILDLGGVLLNLNYQLTIDAFTALGIKDFQSLYTQANQTDIFNQIEKGEIKDGDFIKGLMSFLPKNTSTEDVTNAWNAMLLNFPAERLAFLKKLKTNYNVVLLSNTNTIHLDYFHKDLKEKHGIESLDDYFDHVYFSCDMGMRKPDSEIFEEVCKKENFTPEETLFIDDSIQHVEGAKAIGINAHLLDVKKTDVIQLVRSLLAKFNQ